MPNWCSNVLVVEGVSEKIDEFDQKFKGRPPLFPLQEVEKLNKTEEEIQEVSTTSRLKPWACGE